MLILLLMVSAHKVINLCNHRETNYMNKYKNYSYINMILSDNNLFRDMGRKSIAK